MISGTNKARPQLRSSFGFSIAAISAMSLGVSSVGSSYTVFNCCAIATCIARCTPKIHRPCWCTCVTTDGQSCWRSVVPTIPKAVLDCVKRNRPSGRGAVGPPPLQRTISGFNNIQGLGDGTRLNKCLNPAISLLGWVDLKPAVVVYARAQGNLTCFPEASDVYCATGRPVAAQRILPTRPTRHRSDFCKLSSYCKNE